MEKEEGGMAEGGKEGRGEGVKEQQREGKGGRAAEEVEEEDGKEEDRKKQQELEEERDGVVREEFRKCSFRLRQAAYTRVPPS